MKQMYGQKDKKEMREDCDPLNPTKDAREASMEEMPRLIRNLTKKMSI
jgi:hypothetical protein